MAGEWIKMSVGLRRHPKVVRMASALKADRLRVVGALHAVWSVFDEHSPDGTLDGYTAQVMDEEIGWKGFSAALAAVGWLEVTDAGLEVPRYDDHNGPTAKRRAQETKRKQEERSAADKKAPDKQKDSGHLSASDADKMRTRGEGEERREEERGEDARTRMPAGEACLRMKAAGLQAVNPGHPKLLALLQAGMTVDELESAASDAVKAGKPFAYALATAEGRRRDAAASALPAQKADWTAGAL